MKSRNTEKRNVRIGKDFRRTRKDWYKEEKNIIET